MTKMRLMSVLLWACFAHVAGAQQLEVNLTLAYTTFITGEPVLAQFDMVNATREYVRVGEGQPDSAFVEITLGWQYNELPTTRTDVITGPFEVKPGAVSQRPGGTGQMVSVFEEGRYMAVWSSFIADAIRVAAEEFRCGSRIHKKDGVQCSSIAHSCGGFQSGPLEPQSDGSFVSANRGRARGARFGITIALGACCGRSIPSWTSRPTAR
jgi:hypothetical protein